MRRCANVFVWACLWLLASRAPAAETFTIEPVNEGKELRVHVRPFQSFDPGLLEVIDAATGRCVKTLFAGPMPRAQSITLTPKSGLASGKYLLRYRQGLELEFDWRLPEPGPDGRVWTNPTDLIFANGSLYVIDSVLPMLDVSVPHLEHRPWTRSDGTAVRARFGSLAEGKVMLATQEGAEVVLSLEALRPEDQRAAQRIEGERQELLRKKAENVTRIYKLGLDGRPDLSFGDRGRIMLPADRYFPIRTFAVDGAGTIYVSSTYHEVMRHDAQGKRLPGHLGGWDNDPFGPRCTGWVNSMVLGRDNRMYLPNSYGNIKAYDITRNGFEGALYFLKLPQNAGLDRSVTTDLQGGVYVLGGGESGSIMKLRDDGASLTVEHVSGLGAKLVSPTGPHASAGLLWVADRGPSPGPFWDSGGGGELALYLDDGAQCRLVQRFGEIGSTPDLPEFLHPSAVQVTPDHRQLWVVEDGTRHEDWPRGNARIRRFNLVARHEAEAALELAWE